MKRFFTMALLCVLCATVSSALEFTSGDFTYSILEDETGTPTTNVAVVGCSLPNNSEVTIPSHVENEGTQYTVTKLTSLRNSAPGPHTPAGLHIPETVVEMDESFMYYYGFNDTISVEETNPSFAVSEGILYSKDLTVMCGFPRNQDHITIPSTVKRIKYGAASFSKISELHIPEGVETIETLAFGYASVLTSIALPNSLKKIESMAFLNCNISQVFIPANTQLDTTFDTPFTGCPIESFSINPFINGNYSVYDGCIYTKDLST